ncbi:hypothetical protein HGRIS_009198 [Hohenbuehelia grisea]|uniref:Aminoacyl-transfer RNA synthetases class-II family profile domain-containing protein n=1 Tax=Hohenbuehelia grisea TaxID=104357 RepID=A0ABR3J0D6_9AGAR
MSRLPRLRALKHLSRPYHSITPNVHDLLTQPLAENGTTVSAHGWLKSIRRQKKVAFAVLSDGSDTVGLQAVFEDPAMTKSFTNGTAVQLSGELMHSRAAGQDREILVRKATVVGQCDIQNYPIQKKALTNEYLRDNVHLRARTDRIASMLRLRSACSRLMHKEFEGMGFMHTHPPILTSSDCEGAGEAFRIASAPQRPSPSPDPDPELPAESPSSSTSPLSPVATTDSEFFGRPAYLTVSSQLHLEALSWAMDRVYTLGPCFRAERSMTGRHLAEFWMLEAEWVLDQDHRHPTCHPPEEPAASPAICEELTQICDVVERVLKGIIQPCFEPKTSLDRVLAKDITLLWNNSSIPTDRTEWLRKAAQSSDRWPLMTYSDAVDVLRSATLPTGTGSPFEFKPTWGEPLRSEHERYLAEEIAQGPIFICNYPASLKPFYMRANDPRETDGPNTGTVACFDLLVPGIGELAGGSVREERLPVLEASLERVSEKWREEYGWYADLRRYGGAPHGGFGVGFERLVSWISGIESVRECIPIPRWTGRMDL